MEQENKSGNNCFVEKYVSKVVFGVCCVAAAYVSYLMWGPLISRTVSLIRQSNHCIEEVVESLR